MYYQFEAYLLTLNDSMRPSQLKSFVIVPLMIQLLRQSDKITSKAQMQQLQQLDDSNTLQDFIQKYIAKIMQKLDSKELQYLLNIMQPFRRNMTSSQVISDFVHRFIYYMDPNVINSEQIYNDVLAFQSSDQQYDNIATICLYNKRAQPIYFKIPLVNQLYLKRTYCKMDYSFKWKTYEKSLNFLALYQINQLLDSPHLALNILGIVRYYIRRYIKWNEAIQKIEITLLHLPCENCLEILDDIELEGVTRRQINVIKPTCNISHIKTKQLIISDQSNQSILNPINFALRYCNNSSKLFNQQNPNKQQYTFFLETPQIPDFGD